jgi:hypothetical protein
MGCRRLTLSLRSRTHLEVGGDRWADGNAEGTVSDVGAPSFTLKSKKQQR